MNQNLIIFSIKNSRWIACWMQRYCNATMMNAVNIRKTKGASLNQSGTRKGNRFQHNPMLTGEVFPVVAKAPIKLD